MRTRAIIATTGLACGLVLFAASPATAASGTAWSGEAARTRFDDSVDKYEVCDLADDEKKAVGWIEVKQADGSWKQFPKEVVVGGIGHCNPRDVEVLREDAPLRVYACLKTAAGAQINCEHTLLDGS